MINSQRNGLRQFSRFLLGVATVVVSISVAHTANAAEASLGVTQITAVKTSATADDTYTNGWSWVFDVTVPLNETLLQMKFADWVNGSNIISAAGNMRFYSAQATDAFDAPDALTIDQSNAYGTATMHLDSTKDLDLTKAGRQIKIVMDTKVPNGSGGGSYSSSYGINTSHDPSIPVAAGIITVSAASDNPSAFNISANADTQSDKYELLAFNLANEDASDSHLSTLAFTVATSSASGIGTNLANLIQQANLIIGGTTYPGVVVNSTGQIEFDNLGATLPANQTAEGTVNVILRPQSGNYASTGTSLSVSLTGNATNVVSTSAATGLTANVSGTAAGHTQTVILPPEPGISVNGNSMSATQTYNSTTPASSYGTFTLKFDVTAIGDDVYIPKTIDSPANTSGHTASTTYVGVVVDPSMSASTTDSVVTKSLTTTADSDNSNFYVVHDGDTETFTATVVINPLGLSSSLTNFQVGLDKIQFSFTDSNLNSLQVVDVDETNSDFHTDTLTVAG